MRKFVQLLLALIWLAGCATAPYTGRHQMMLVSERQEMTLGEDAYRQILRDSVVTREADAERIVRNVGERIARAAEKPEYKWEFTIINDPDTVNAFAVPGGKVAVYTGIFGPARDDAGLAVVLGHEIAHALLRHPAERMSQDMLVQVGGMGLGLALGRNPALANQVMQVYGLGAGVGLTLPFSRAQESEADRVGLILMAKAGYDPRAAIDLWERMEKIEKKGAGASQPPEFLSTHPGYEIRVSQLREHMNEALKFYRPSNAGVELLPTAQTLDTAAAKSERELLKRMQAINTYVGQQNGERPVVEALSYQLRLSLQTIVQERQQLGIGYGQYAALRGIAYVGHSSINRVVDQYQRGRPWSDIAQSNGSRINDLTDWIGELIRTTNTRAQQLRGLRPNYRGP